MLEKIRLIDRFTETVGKTVRWFALLMVILTCLVVALRYVFYVPSVALQESVSYLHAALFMLGAAYTWQQGGHVRVDVFYHSMSRQKQHWVDRLGIIFLLFPVCLFMLYSSWEYVSIAWQIGEKSQEAGGLPFVYLLKTLILVMPLLMLIQAVAELLRTFLPETVQKTHTASKEVHHG
ncbi:TRAP transporter small permease subunit [Bacterioplanoides sp.]|uniref:TRAP transporter small permease subunit n=1 Tax=Bacterioplanoides sp. TaxID=2066072 RepID=UPI003B005D54